MTDLLIGVRCFIRGFSLMLTPGVRSWAFIPMILSALLYVGLIWAAAEWMGPHLDDLETSLDASLPSWLDWVSAILGPLLWILYWLAALLVVTFTFVIVASVVASPFNGPLAEAAEHALTAQAPPTTSWLRILTRLPGVLIQETKKVLYAVFWSIPFLLLLFIPVAGQILWFLWNAWITALAFTDYPLDNNGFRFADMRRMLRRRHWAAYGFGAAALFTFTIPILNLFAVPASVCGATLLWIEVLRPQAVAEGWHPPPTNGQPSDS